MISPSQIRAGRSILNVKQSELAKAAGISLATLNNIERGVGDPRASTLEAIERALYRAGVSVEGDGISETLQFHKLARPSVYETYQASQRILESLGRDSLLKVERILFFVRRDRSAGTDKAGDNGLRLCLMLDGRARTLLFDQVSFTFANGARTAESAGVLYAAFLTHGASLFFLDTIQEDTTLVSLRDAFDQLHEQEWVRMRHPKDLVDLMDDWDAMKSRYSDRDGHPMAQLLSVTEESIVLEDDPEEEQEADTDEAAELQPPEEAAGSDVPQSAQGQNDPVRTPPDQSDEFDADDFDIDVDFGPIGDDGGQERT